MRQEQFVRREKERAGLDTTDQASKLTEVVLTALVGRIERGERANLASELPGEFSKYFDSGSDEDLLPAREFVNLIGARYDGSYQRTGELISTVLGTLRKVVSEGRVRRLPDQLSEEYVPLFSRA